eukprot:SAG31_NODE_102_length_25175_cov_10.778553_18_plen_235_part_00
MCSRRSERPFLRDSLLGTTLTSHCPLPSDSYDTCGTFLANVPGTSWFADFYNKCKDAAEVPTDQSSAGPLLDWQIMPSPCASGYAYLTDAEAEANAQQICGQIGDWSVVEVSWILDTRTCAYRLLRTSMELHIEYPWAASNIHGASYRISTGCFEHPWSFISNIHGLLRTSIASAFGTDHLERWVRCCDRRGHRFRMRAGLVLVVRATAVSTLRTVVLLLAQGLCASGCRDLAF